MSPLFVQTYEFYFNISVQCISISGQKCSDSGTPAEAVQNVTNYEADKKLHYTCNRAGYQPVLSTYPPDQEYTCTFDSNLNRADWVPSLATLPVCTGELRGD